MNEEKNKEKHNLYHFIFPFFATMPHISGKKCKDHTPLSSIWVIGSLSLPRLIKQEGRNLSMDKQ